MNTSSDFPRPTPYELVFRATSDDDVADDAPERPDFEGDRFPRILAEADSIGGEPDDPTGFVMLSSVGSLIQELMLDEAAPDAAGVEWEALPPEAVAEVGALLFHAFRFWRGGRRVLELDRALARHLVEAPAPEAGWRMAAPESAGYVQLPRNLFWSRSSEGARPEPVDGFFWSVGESVQLLIAAGVREGRPGFTAIPVGAELDPDGDAPWLAADGRPGGTDFENVLPGGEMDGLYALTTPAEALKLACLCFHWVDRWPESMTPERGPAEEASGVLRSRVTLAGG